MDSKKTRESYDKSFSCINVRQFSKMGSHEDKIPKYLIFVGDHLNLNWSHQKQISKDFGKNRRQSITMNLWKKVFELLTVGMNLRTIQ